MIVMDERWAERISLGHSLDFDQAQDLPHLADHECGECGEIRGHKPDCPHYSMEETMDTDTVTCKVDGCTAEAVQRLGKYGRLCVEHRRERQLAAAPTLEAATPVVNGNGHADRAEDDELVVRGLVDARDLVVDADLPEALRLRVVRTDSPELDLLDDIVATCISRVDDAIANAAQALAAILRDRVREHLAP